ncbi:MAG: glycosyltransferase [Oscillospiraceae bacterium]
MDKILLFIPMYNCEKRIVRVLAQLDKTVCEYISAVIVVNNRSTDNGEQAVKGMAQGQPPRRPGHAPAQ